MQFFRNNKALFAGTTGTVLQWYDFSLFGYLTPIIASTYFPHENHLASLLSAFAVFAVGFLLAPLGSVFFGYIGDRYGRKRALTLSIIAMAIPTSLIAILPGYQKIGIIAPLLLTVFRLTQGFVASAEFAGSSIFLVEHAPEKKRYFYGSLTSTAYSSGTILGSLVASAATLHFMPDWAWRIPFALAIVGGALIYFLRTQVDETPQFKLTQDLNLKIKAPFYTAFKEMPSRIFAIIGIACYVSVITFGSYVYLASYLHLHAHLALSSAILIISVGLMVDAALEPFIAMLADKIGAVRIILFGMVSMMILIVPIFYLLSSGVLINIVIGMISLSVLIAISYAPLNTFMVSLFPTEYRYSGFAISFNVGTTIFGGTTPFLLTYLVYHTHNLLAPSLYYILSAIIAISCVIFVNAKSKICSAYRIEELRNG